jgi:hypothetical protein
VSELQLDKRISAKKCYIEMLKISFGLNKPILLFSFQGIKRRYTAKGLKV